MPALEEILRRNGVRHLRPLSPRTDLFKRLHQNQPEIGLNQKGIWRRRPSARLIPWYGIGMREKASVLSDLSNVLGAVLLSHPKRVLKKMTFQYAKATR